MELITKISNALESYILSKAKSNNIFAEYYNRTRKVADFKREAIFYKEKTIKDWKLAVMAATDPDNPRRGELMRFYQSLMLDNHLASVIDTRILKVQRSSRKIVDDKGVENEALTELLDRPWFDDLIKYVEWKNYEGTNLIEMFETDNNGELARVTKIPQSNFIPTKGIIIKEEYDNDGVLYKEGIYSDYYVQIGSDYELGILNELAIIVLAKKLGLGSWMSYIEKFGVPAVFATTERMDEGRLNELFNMLSEFRSNHFLVLQGSEKVEIPNNNNMDGYQSFKALNEFADSQISKRILGGTASTDEKSFTGAALVQERVAQDRYEADKLLFKYYFNTHIRQRLAKISSVYKDFATHYLVWDNQETLPIKDYIEGVEKLSSFYEFDIEEIKLRTGLPIIGVKQNPFLPIEPEPTQKKKNSTNALGLIHSESKDIIHARTWDKAAERLAEQLYNKEIKPQDLDKDLLLKNYAAFSDTAKTTYGDNYYTNQTTRQFRENMLKFSGAKAHNLMQQLDQLRESNSNKETFIQEAKKLINKHNETYLNVEKKFVANKISSAKDFEQFVEDIDIYPNLKNRTMLDSQVRDSHAVNEGVIKPVSEWTEIPPYDPGCRCWLEQTTEEPTKRGLANIDIKWATNPIKTGEIFSKKHNYFTSIPDKKTADAIRENTEKAKAFIPYNRVIDTAEGNKIFINDFADLKDMGENIKAAEKLTKGLNKNIYIRPHINSSTGIKNAEYGIDEPNNLADLKTYETESSSINRFITNRFKAASKQNCQYVIFDITNADKKDIQKSLVDRLKGSLNKDLNKSIKQVIFIKGDDVYKISRKQVQAFDFNNIKPLL